MFLIKRNLGLAAHLVIWAGAALVPAGAAMATPDGVSVSLSFGAPLPPLPARPYIVECVRESNYAGTLTIDGRIFVLNTACAVREQIRDAFRCMGYHAWLVGGGSVRVRKDCEGPEVCWRNGDFGLVFGERATTITLTPDACAHDHYGHTYRYCYDRVHQRYGSYRQVHGYGGRTEWSSIGFSVFINGDHDHHARTNDGNVRRWDGGHDGDHRVERGPRDDGRRRSIDNGNPGRTTDARRRTDDRDRQPGLVVKPSTPPVAGPEDLKRTPVNRVERPSAMPVKRVESARPAPVVKAPVVKQPAPAVKQPAPKGSDGAKAREKALASTPAPAKQEAAPAGKPQGKDAKKGKW